MIARIWLTYADDMDYNDYEEGEKITIPDNVLSAGYQILENPDDDETDRTGGLSTSGIYELHDGQLCGLIDGKYLSCENDDYERYCEECVQGEGGLTFADFFED